jgi:hypothetical protein
VTQHDGQLRATVEASIRQAFEGVRLGDGVSLFEAKAIDGYYERISQAEVHRMRSHEVTDDWSALTPSDLDTEDIAHLDPEGLRYYLPALMLRLLDDYQPGEMWCIGTIRRLNQREPHPLGFVELLTPAQRGAIADYVEALPELVRLDHEDATTIDPWLAETWRAYA